MNTIRTQRLWSAVCLLLCTHYASTLPAQEKSTGPADVQATTMLSLERIFGSNEFQDKNPSNLLWRKAGGGYFIFEKSKTSEGKDFVFVDAKTDQREVWIEAQKLNHPQTSKPISIESFDFSSDEKRLLIYTNSRKVWRQNTRGDYWLFDRSSQSLRQLGGQAEEATMMFAKFSPDGKQVAFVRQNNIYVQDLSTFEIKPLTTDGSVTTINGTSDWVYEEELDVRDGYRWSPDSKSIAFWQLDTTGVRVFYLINNTDQLYSQPIPIPYPKVGEQNAAGRIGIVTIDGTSPRWCNIPGDPRNHYVAQLEWSPDGSGLMLQQFNRLQNRNTVYRVDPKTGESRSILVEEDSAWLENENPFRWIGNGSNFLWISERSGWRSAYRAKLDGNDNLTKIIEEDFDLIAVEAVDDASGLLYFSASPQNATQRYLYRVKLSGGRAERITPADQAGWHLYNIAPDRKFAVHTYSSFGVPPRIELIQLPSHEIVRVLEENLELRKKIESLDRPQNKFLKLDITDKKGNEVSSSDRIELDAWVLLPPQFDATKKYPLFLHVYGEPHGQTVKDSWSGKQGLWHQMLAQQGYIVASIDNRGTMSPRGRAWRKVVHRQIGTLASSEQAKGAKELLKLIPAADEKRIGIWGWSGGGSMSLNAIFRYPEIYRMAIAVAPVPNQLLYDTIYQERYMGLPKDNSEGYSLGSPLTFAHQLQGKLLLIHGTGDDNCHYQGVERLMNELILHNKPFSVMPYPNRSHSINEGSNTTRHLYELMTRYLQENLTSQD